MSFLLDVNILLALGYANHVHYSRVEGWLVNARAESARPLRLATCAITELGFVRIASGPARFAPDVPAAIRDLRRVVSTDEFVFVGDKLSALRLQPWVRRPAQTTDGHLLELAERNGMQLATLDEGIPGAVVIPRIPGPLRVSESLLADDEADAAYGPREQHSVGLWIN